MVEGLLCLEITIGDGCIVYDEMIRLDSFDIVGRKEKEEERRREIIVTGRERERRIRARPSL